MAPAVPSTFNTASTPTVNPVAFTAKSGPLPAVSPNPFLPKQIKQLIPS